MSSFTRRRHDPVTRRAVGSAAARAAQAMVDAVTANPFVERLCLICGTSIADRHGKARLCFSASCREARHKEYYAHNKERYLRAARKWRDENPEKYRVCKVKCDARRSAAVKVLRELDLI